MKTYLTSFILFFSLISAFPQANQSIKFKDKTNRSYKIVAGIGMNNYYRDNLGPNQFWRDTLNVINQFLKPGLKFNSGVIREQEFGKNWSWRLGLLADFRQTVIENLPWGGESELAAGKQWTVSLRLNSGFNYYLSQTDKQKLYLIGEGVYHLPVINWGGFRSIDPTPGNSGFSRFVFFSHNLGVAGGIGLKKNRFSTELIGGLTSSLSFNRSLTEIHTFFEFQMGYFLKS